MVPLGTSWPETYWPSAVWANGRLDVAFAVMPEVGASRIDLCSAEADPYLSCVERFPLASPSEFGPVLALREGGYGLCWTEDYYPWGVPMLQLLDESRRPTGMELDLGLEGTQCAGLAIVGDTAIVLLAHLVDVAPNFTLEEIDLVTGEQTYTGGGGLTADGIPRTSLDADGDLLAYAHVGDTGQSVTAHNLTSGVHLQVSDDVLGEVSVSVREELVGLLWSERLGDTRELRFGTVDPDVGFLTDETLITTVDGELGPIELEAVWDGFLVTYWQHDGAEERLTVVPLRFARDPKEYRARRSIAPQGDPDATA